MKVTTLSATKIDVDEVLSKFSFGEIDVINGRQGDFYPIKIHNGKKIIFDTTESTRWGTKLYVYVSKESFNWYTSNLYQYTRNKTKEQRLRRYKQCLTAEYRYVVAILPTEFNHQVRRYLTLGDDFALIDRFGHDWLQPLGPHSDVIPIKRAADEKMRRLHFGKRFFDIAQFYPEDFEAIMQEIDQNVPTEFRIN